MITLRLAAIALLAGSAASLSAQTGFGMPADRVRGQALVDEAVTDPDVHIDTLPAEPYLPLLRIGPEHPEHGALLIVAGLDSRHQIGVETAFALANRLAAHRREHPDAISSQRTIYIAPMTSRMWTVDQAVDDQPRRDFGGLPLPVDDDRDRRIDEDGPQDINGDGVITMMRIADPPIGSGLTRTHVIDPDEPRLMREPKPGEGEHATHVLIIEGRDTDGDGRIAEDPIGGLDLDRSFPYRWPEHADDAGDRPLSAAESRALVQWMLQHDEITCVLVYGLHDTIVSMPMTGKSDDTRRVPLGILDEDKPTWELIGERFKSHTGIQKGADTPDLAGSFLGWSYAHFGAFTFGTPIWVRPDLVEKKPAESEAQAPDEETPQAADAPEPDASLSEVSEVTDSAPAPDENAPPAEAPEGKPEKQKDERKKPSSPDAWWLRHFDDDRSGAGFVDWTPFEHPDLGPVEIGGFIPGARINPPAEGTAELIDHQFDFVLDLLDRMPRLETDPPLVESLGADVHRVTLRIRNAGGMPTRPAIADRINRLHPLIVTMDVDPQRVVGESRRQRIGALAPGEERELSWLVIGDPGATVPLQIQSPEFGDRTIEVTLEESR